MSTNNPLNPIPSKDPTNHITDNQEHNGPVKSTKTNREAHQKTTQAPNTQSTSQKFIEGASSLIDIAKRSPRKIFGNNYRNQPNYDNQRTPTHRNKESNKRPRLQDSPTPNTGRERGPLFSINRNDSTTDTSSIRTHSSTNSTFNNGSTMTIDIMDEFSTIQIVSTLRSNLKAACSCIRALTNSNEISTASGDQETIQYVKEITDKLTGSPFQTAAEQHKSLF
jgi:hypothetical protein